MRSRTYSINGVTKRVPSILVGGVIIERESFRLRCRVGLHRWQLFTMAWTFIRQNPNYVNVSRRCMDCGAMMCVEQRADGSQYWIGRL